MLNNLLLRKVKDSDFKNIAKLFKLIFKKKISKKFYNWRYFNKTYTSFIALHKNRIVAHVGFTHYKLDNSSNKIFSRHSTFVVPEFQKMGIYQKLLKYSFEKLKTKSKFVIAWPNKANLIASKSHAKFKIIGKYNLFRKNYYSNKKNKFFKKLNKDFFKKNNIDQKNHIFFKDKKFIKWRYFNYKKKSFYSINLKQLENFIFQKQNQGKNSIYSIIDYYGKYIHYQKELKILINFLIKKKISFQLFIPTNKKVYNSIIKKEKISKVAEFNVGLYNIGNKKNNKIEIKKKIYDIIKISDTDVFIETF